MSNQNTPPAPRGGLSLYANLLDPSSSSNSAAIISRAPVAFNNGDVPDEEASAKKQQINAAALRFQPTKRPQLSSQKGKPKPAFPRPAAPVDSDSTKQVLGTTDSTVRNPAKSTLADWAVAGDDDDVNGFYGGGEKRQRGGRKRRKKNRNEYTVTQDWDDIYDPSRPNNYDEYKHSDEQIREIREWKDRLYAHRKARKYSSDFDSDEESTHPSMRNQFAPPPSFAPPSNYAPPPPPPETYDDQTGDDAYTRRLKLSENISFEPVPDNSSPPYSPPPPEPVAPGVISRAPVRYNLPAAPPEIPTSEAELERALAEGRGDEENEAGPSEDQPRSSRPGQAGFAERLMSKYGWSKGSGLGADGSGIVSALHVQVQKRKKKPDSEGGGFADPKGIGKIVGGKRNTTAEQNAGKFGAMSEVVILKGMVDGMNLDDEVEGAGDGGLMQEIGDECGEKYGNVERVFIKRSMDKPATVFVKFTSQLSGLRAVNALEGRMFNGNIISARFYDAEKFEEGIYE